MRAYLDSNRRRFEVVSDVLYLDGQVFHYGDELNPLDVGARLIDLIALNMIRPIEGSGNFSFPQGFLRMA